MTLRKCIFWLHLTAGLIAGFVIGMMSFTGVLLAFESEIVAWAERDVRIITPPSPGAPRLSLEELQERFRPAYPAARPTAIIISALPSTAVVFNVGREAPYYLDPYSGEARQPTSTKMRDFMRSTTDWHRWLALSGDNRPVGRAITGVCNLAFLVLALSGIFLWWPRKWRTKGWHRSLWFLRQASGRARDWNWHNVVGFWFLPVLIVLTASGAVISYQWASDLVYRAAGEIPPLQGAAAPATALFDPPKDDPVRSPLGLSGAVELTKSRYASWETITVRLPNAPARPPTTTPTSPANATAPIGLTIKLPGIWPRTASTSVSLNPFTGEEIKREEFSNFSPGRQARVWLRFLHTGQALGPIGQLVAGLASAGGCLLVYTGFSLAWRRYREWRAEEKSASAS